MKSARLSSFAAMTIACTLNVVSEGRAQAASEGAVPSNMPIVDDYKITILSDSIPGRTTIGEWGFSALVEVTSGGVTKRFLFDASDKAGTVLFNANMLKLDICSVEDIVISHNHADHTGGLDSLRRSCAEINPNGISKAHVGAPEIFWPRIGDDGKQKNPFIKVKASYEATGGALVVNDQPHEFLLPGVYLTGRIPRTHDEKTYLPVTPMKLQDPSGNLVEDLVPEDQALVINTAAGVVVLTGCAHAGAINTIEQAVRIVGGKPNVILAGGLHWYQMEQGDRSTVGTLDWEAQAMADLNVVAMLGGHCTGFERFFYIRQFLGLDQSRAAISAVGTVMGSNQLFSYTFPQTVNSPIPLDPNRRNGGSTGKR